MPLHVGETAPDFTLYDDERRAWSLIAQRGHPVVLLFFPGAFTSVCTTELNTVNNDLARYTAGGARIVGLSTDSPDALAEFKKVNDFRFPLLSDHDAEVAEAYGVRFSEEEHRLGFSRIAKRAVFVVDGDGRVSHAELTAHPGVEPDYGALLDAVDEASRQ
jgi:peroxiredoxin